MNLLQTAAELLISKLGPSIGNLDLSTVQSALGSLLGGSDGQLDLAALVSKFSGDDLVSLAQSWLGDGANSAVSPDQILSVLGDANVGDFASKLGIDKGEAAGGLADVIPSLIDQSSSGGNLLDAVGGADGLLGAASKLF